MLLGSSLPRRLMLLQLSLIIVLLQCQASSGVCCPSKTIAFQLIDQDDDCRLYDAKESQNATCTMSICDDGTAVQGSYCGQGPCNIFGCSCEDGCRNGNALQTFQDYYGDYHIKYVRFI